MPVLEATSFWELLLETWRTVSIIVVSTVVVLAIVLSIFPEIWLIRLVDLTNRTDSSGKEGMIGQPVEARTALNPRGRVNYQGRIWNAEMLEGTADEGEELSIAEVKGLRLIVRRPGD